MGTNRDRRERAVCLCFEWVVEGSEISQLLDEAESGGFFFFVKGQTCSPFTLMAEPICVYSSHADCVLSSFPLRLPVVGRQSSAWLRQADQPYHNNPVPPAFFFFFLSFFLFFNGRGALSSERQVMTSSWHFPPCGHRKVCHRVRPDTTGSMWDIQTQAASINSRLVRPQFKEDGDAKHCHLNLDILLFCVKNGCYIFIFDYSSFVQT